MNRASAAGIAALALVLQGPARGQAPAGDRLAALGASLFSNVALSSGRATSCATCHDPKKSFVDGKPDSEGEMKIGIGRNSPALWAIAAIPKFRDPRQAQEAKPGRA